MYQKFLIKNKDGNPSTTLTAFVLGFLVVSVKLLLSGVTIGGFTLAPFTGVEFGASIAALGGIYCLKNPAQEKKDGNKNDW